MGSLSLVVAAADDLPGRATPQAEARLRRLFAENYDFIWRTLRRLGLDAASSDDAAQQVFVTASRKLDGIRPGVERGYLFGVALRVASDARRAAGRRRERSFEALEGDAEPADPTPSPERVLDEQRARALLDVALDKLPMDLRVVFVLHELEELSMSEIASLVGIPPGTVASRLRRAREEFEACVQRASAIRRGAR